MRVLVAETILGRGAFRGVVAIFFALALALSMAAPAVAQDEAGQGIFIGQMEEVNEEEQWIDAMVAFVGEDIGDLPDQLEEAWEEEDPELIGEFFQRRFNLTHDDDYLVNFEESDKEHFLCVAALNVDEMHLFAAGIQNGDDDNGDDNGLGDVVPSEFHEEDENGDDEDGNLFALLVEDDECPDEDTREDTPDNGQPQPRDDGRQVEQPRRIDTGAGGASTSALAAVAGFLALTAAGVAVARRRSS